MRNRRDVKSSADDNTWPAADSSASSMSDRSASDVTC
jgi:hypothetical protein